VNSGKVARVEIDPKPTPGDVPVANTAPTPVPATVSLGMSAESVTLGTRSALKVIRVDPAGVAAKAGLEPGDLVVAANGVPTTNVEQLLSALRKSGQVLNLTVRDARTGRDTDVAVNLGTTKTTPAKEVESPVTQAPGKLGAVTELAFHDSDFAVKVTEVTPGSAAARAGLRPGVIITAANGKPVLHPNDLNDLVRTSMGALKLSLVDPASGKQSTVEVNLGK
jgi:serine protease Do